jgi:hypothetical protein
LERGGRAGSAAVIGEYMDAVQSRMFGISVEAGAQGA